MRPNILLMGDIRLIISNNNIVVHTFWVVFIHSISRNILTGRIKLIVCQSVWWSLNDFVINIVPALIMDQNWNYFLILYEDIFDYSYAPNILSILHIQQTTQCDIINLYFSLVFPFYRIMKYLLVLFSLSRIQAFLCVSLCDLCQIFTIIKLSTSNMSPTDRAAWQKK